jgi:hypothetical protein
MQFTKDLHYIRDDIAKYNLNEYFILQFRIG